MQRKYSADHLNILERSGLFADLSLRDIEELLDCLRARTAEYAKNEIIIQEGGIVSDIGIVLSGCAQSVKIGESGRTTIVTLLDMGSFIGIFLAAGKDRESPVTVLAAERLTALFIPFDAVIGRCSAGCARHEVLLRNCFDCIARKSLILHDRIDCLIRPTVREKIIAFLNKLAKENGSQAFMVPFDRNAMAEYINVDRSALSRELSKMKKDGLIDFYKNSFKMCYSI